MAILKTRPKLSLLAPRLARQGEKIEVAVRLDCAEAVTVTAVNVELRGAMVSYASGRQGQDRSRDVFLRQVATMARDREFTAGDHELRITFEIPPDAPGSYDGSWFEIEYEIRVHVDIPWWPDARARYALMVAPRAFAAESARTVFVTRIEGPEGRKPYAEVSLASFEIEAGQTLHGSVSLSNVVHNRYRAVNLSMIAKESFDGSYQRVHHERDKVHWRLEPKAFEEGAPIPFKLKIPKDLRPSFVHRGAALGWVMLVNVEIGLARDLNLRLPVHVSPIDAAPDRSEARPLAVGNVRQQMIWQRVADDAGYAYAAGELRSQVGERGPIGLRIRQRDGGRDGAQLQGELLFPGAGLGIGLRLAARGLGLAARDEGHTLWLREIQFPEFELADADDRALRMIDDNSGLDEQRVRRMAHELRELGLALWSKLPQMPAPSSMRAAIPAWERAASNYPGALDRAAVRIVAFEEGRRFGARAKFKASGELDHLEVFVGGGPALDARHYADWEPRQGSNLAVQRPELAALLEGAEALRIGHEGAVLELDAGTPPARACERSIALHELVQNLAGARRGYR